MVEVEVEHGALRSTGRVSWGADAERPPPTSAASRAPTSPMPALEPRRRGFFGALAQWLPGRAPPTDDGRPGGGAPEDETPAVEEPPARSVADDPMRGSGSGTGRFRSVPAQPAQPPHPLVAWLRDQGDEPAPAGLVDRILARARGA